MNIVLYTQDYEPITILDLPLWVIEEAERRGVVRIAVQEPVVTSTNIPDLPDFKTVDIHCYKLRWRDGSTKTVLVTYNEELALRLRPSWLPGQQATINTYKLAIVELTNNLVKALRKN